MVQLRIRKILFGCLIVVLASIVGFTGINWGIPTNERINLLFGDEGIPSETIEELIEARNRDLFNYNLESQPGFYRLEKNEF